MDGGAQWKDVGIWSETEWTVFMGKALGSMSTLDKILTAAVLILRLSTDVPVGATRVCEIIAASN